jgi:hypothetical protein
LVAAMGGFCAFVANIGSVSCADSIWGIYEQQCDTDDGAVS